MKRTLYVLLLWPLAAVAQDLSLKEAVKLALEKSRPVEATAAARAAAESRVMAARGARLPRVDYSESWTRSDNPVFVFSSLLTQHQFGDQNFAVGTLNRPGFVNNFASRVTVDESIYDGGRAKSSIRAAELGIELTGEDQRRARMEAIASVARSYYDATLSAEQVKTAAQAMKSAQADLERAENVRAAGMSTDADVLSIRVHLAGVKERQIRAEADLEVARAALNDAMGIALDTPHELSTPLAPLPLDARALAECEVSAGKERPEARQAKLAASLAETQSAAARSDLLPQVGAHAGFEADRQDFYNKGGANWLVSIEARWNIFSGGSGKARAAESQSMLRRSQVEASQADSAVRLQVRRAYADLRAARERIEVASAAVAEAEESLRITQNRYGSGLGNVTDLLRTETAALEAHARRLQAVHDERVAATMLELAAGTLSADSEVLNEGSR